MRFTVESMGLGLIMTSTKLSSDSIVMKHTVLPIFK